MSTITVKELINKLSLLDPATIITEEGAKDLCKVPLELTREDRQAYVEDNLKAIKELRNRAGCTLTEAKDLFESSGPDTRAYSINRLTQLKEDFHETSWPIKTQTVELLQKALRAMKMGL